MSKVQDRYPPFEEWVWKGFGNSKEANIDEFVEANWKRGRAFHIGSDSKDYGKKTLFATALIAHHPYGGGTAIFHKDKTMLFPSLRQKLVMEAFRTLEVAWYLDQILPPEARIRIHVDFNDSIRYKSGQYKEELVGMIMAQGYVPYRDIKNKEDHPRIVFWKPHSWAASSVADKKT